MFHENPRWRSPRFSTSIPEKKNLAPQLAGARSDIAAPPIGTVLPEVRSSPQPTPGEAQLRYRGEIQAENHIFLNETW